MRGESLRIYECVVVLCYICEYLRGVSCGLCVFCVNNYIY